MKTKEMTQTEFSKWFFEQVQTIEHFPFDSFYDCHLIVKRMREVYGSATSYEKPKNECVPLFYAVSKTGTHLFDTESENSNILHIVNNRYDGHKFYLLKFYFNYTYYMKQCFVSVTEYTAEEVLEFFI